MPKTPKEQSFTDQITDNKHNARQYAPVTEGSGMKGSLGGAEFAKPRSAGPRCGDLTLRLSHFMAAMFARNSG